MLRFGIVSQINPTLVQAHVNFGDDDSTSFWLPVLQSKTMKDKFYLMPDIGEDVACLMDENSEDGVILGAVYSSEDVPVVTSEKQISLNLENNSLINTDGITSQSDITDKKSSMQAMRKIYNPHTHTGNQGSPTSKPNKSM